MNFCLKGNISGNWQFWAHISSYSFFFSERLLSLVLWPRLTFLINTSSMFSYNGFENGAVGSMIWNSPVFHQTPKISGLTPSDVLKEEKLLLVPVFTQHTVDSWHGARATAQLILTCPLCWDGFENLAVHTGLIRGWAPDSPALAAGQAEVPEIIAF